MGGASDPFAGFVGRRLFQQADPFATGTTGSTGASLDPFASGGSGASTDPFAASSGTGGGLNAADPFAASASDPLGLGGAASAISVENWDLGGGWMSGMGGGA